MHTLPLTFGEFDVRTRAGHRMVDVSHTSATRPAISTLWVHEFVGGERRVRSSKRRKHLVRPHGAADQLTDAQGRSAASRISVLGSDKRRMGPTIGGCMPTMDSIQRSQHEETRYFHCAGECSVTVPLGRRVSPCGEDRNRTGADINVVDAASQRRVRHADTPLTLPDWSPTSVTADLHVHMNYGGHYRNTCQTLAAAGAARRSRCDLQHHREQGAAHSRYRQFGDNRSITGATIFQAQEYHTSFWGHLGLLHLERSSPDAGLQRVPAERTDRSPYPHNGVIADLAHRAGRARRLRASVRLRDRA